MYRLKVNTQENYTIRDISYKERETAGHKLLIDLYLPQHDERPCRKPPVAVFVHGGGWRRGDKDAWKHFIFRDVNLLVAFLFWLFGLYGNVGSGLASRGVPCAVISYPLTTLKSPWLLLELTTSYLSSSLLVTAVSGLIIGGVFLIEFLTPLDLLALSSSVRWWSVSRSTLFLVIIILVNVSVLTLTLFQRKKHGISNFQLYIIWLCVLFSVFFTSFSEHRLLVFSILTFVLSQGILIFLNLQAEDITHTDQVSALVKSVRKVQEIGNETGLYDPTQIFLMGHSAGGHLCTLAVLNPTVMEMAGVQSADIKGVITISAVLHVEKLNIRAVKALYLHPTFGTDPNGWSHACPLSRLKTQAPRHNPTFLVVTAERDWHLTQDAAAFSEELENCDIPRQTFVLPGKSHFSIIAYFDKYCKVLQTSLADVCVEFINNTIKS